jgi:hypothetical protein
MGSIPLTQRLNPRYRLCFEAWQLFSAPISGLLQFKGFTSCVFITTGMPT